MTETQLKDVKCEKCQRVIGQRNDKTFFQFGMKFCFDRSGKVECPFIYCRNEQVFRVNRDKTNGATKILIDNAVILS